jgi:alpha-beta hydrolase superfamily lysophospholipase
MDDAVVLRAGFPRQWANLQAEHPDALTGTSGLHMNWETVDPEKWVPDGYVVVRVDSRGAGRSPGYLGHLLAAGLATGQRLASADFEGGKAGAMKVLG